jgi:23S rRNA (cytosine1962-C5)-methyltransferase
VSHGVFAHEQYELLDFGGGRRLERFGAVVLDRPCPAAAGHPRRGSAADWSQATARFQITTRDAGQWKLRRGATLPTAWQIQCESAVLELRPTPFGHIGVFPEQAANWDWLAARIRGAGRPLKVLNLFAYTGAATLAAAQAGAAVTHVDAARNIVAWARHNAELSQLADAPIRWIVDDARKFVQRELRRGASYDAVILDPPSYGHGPRGETWKIERHLPELLADCATLTAASRAFFVLSGHSPSFGPAELQASLADALCGHCQGGVRGGGLWLSTPDRRRLPSGAVARWPD